MAIFRRFAVWAIMMAFCSTGWSFSDTTRKLLAFNDRVVASKVIREANVDFPDILESSRSSSIAYIEKLCQSRRGYLERTYARSKKYFPKVTSILKKHQVPAEFAVLMALESGFNGNAVSPAGAVGYWQLMDEVAREYGLRIADPKAVKPAPVTKKGKAAKVKAPVDDRKNFIKSTYAAARYLRDRGRNLDNDWLLIAASYNWGVGNVWNAMQRTGKAHPTFWDINRSLPAETKAYVMNFIALNVVFKNYEKFRKNELCFKTIKQEKQGPEADQAYID